MIRHDWVAWAFSQENLHVGEKLVLVYLAAGVGGPGIGKLDRAALAEATGYEPRSLQRQLKTLRDAGLFQEAAEGFYALGVVDGASIVPPAFVAHAPAPSIGRQMLDHMAPIPPAAEMLPEIAKSLAVHLLGEFRAGVLGEEIAEHVYTAGEKITSDLAEFDRKLGDRCGHLLTTLADVAREAEATLALIDRGGTRPPDPPPDPVKESDFYRQLLATGLTEEEAYPLAEKRLGVAADMLAAAGLVKHPRPGQVIEVTPRTYEVTPRTYEDTAVGRFFRVAEIIDPTTRPHTDQRDAWRRLEEAENKNTVKGETVPPFDLLYPAIVQAARANAGKLTLAQFLDEKAIKANRAPWDLMGPAATSEAQLLGEISTMLAEIEQANHPMAQVPPRTTETEGGRTLTESTPAFHARVRRVHQQLKSLQLKGI